MADMATIILTAVVTTVGTGGIAMLTHHLTSKRDWRAHQDRHARYLAIRLVCILDEFINGCSDVVADDGRVDQDGYRCSTAQQPTLEMPSDVEWKSITPSIMYRALALPNLLVSAERTISFVFSDVATAPDFDEYFEDRQYRFGKLGLAALALSDELRTDFEIPPYEFGSSGWHPRPYFEKATVSRDHAIELGRAAAVALAEKA